MNIIAVVVRYFKKSNIIFEVNDDIEFNRDMLTEKGCSLFDDKETAEKALAEKTGLDEDELPIPYYVGFRNDGTPHFTMYCDRGFRNDFDEDVEEFLIDYE